MQKYAQNIAEAIIPLLGFYYWNWNWYFILLFLILDALAKEIILHLKSNKIYATQGGDKLKRIWFLQGLKSAGLSIIVLLMLHGMYYMNHTNVDFTNEILRFLSYKEMGIAQGWVLIPLVVVSVWMPYKYQFLKLGLQTKTQLSKLWTGQLGYKLLVFTLVVVGALIHTLVHLPDFVFVWASVALPFLNVYLSDIKKV